jgi:hypothetical protein
MEYNGASPMTCRQVPLLVPESEKGFQELLDGLGGDRLFWLIGRGNTASTFMPAETIHLIWPHEG